MCYLNTFEKDFHGGLFHFQDGEPSTVVPAMGVIVFGQFAAKVQNSLGRHKSTSKYLDVNFQTLAK